MKHLPLILLLLLCESAASQSVRIDGLGTIDFPNSGAASAQEDFHRGVLLLHSFEFGPAARAFVAAQEADPGFAMAYWGEAMTYNHPLWRQKDLAAGRDALARLASNAQARLDGAGSERERMYIEAVAALYSEGSKHEQDQAYLRAMQRVHEAYPEDNEARAFYALAILGSTNGERDFATYMRGAAVAQPVFDANPDHPGAAHYLIHSFDDPIHAPLGLPAADAYSAIAPNAAHAQHMTSHIFVAMGMWDRVVQANIRAMAVQDGARAAAGRPPNACGHYSSWRHYGHLMLDQIDEANELMDLCHAQTVAGEGNWFYFSVMRARHIVDSEDWSLVDRWKADLEPQDQLDNDASVFGGAEFTYLVTNAFAGLMAGSTTDAESLLGRAWGDHPGRTLQLDQIRALMALNQGESEAALTLLSGAADREAALPFEFGPPAIVKPGFELLGQMLDRLGRNSEEAFREAALRNPGRPLSQSTRMTGSN